MRVVPKVGAYFIAAIVGGATLSAPAHADELVVMPYSCAVVAGRPVLRPSQQEGHSVIGRREQRPFRACSPVNPGMCRQWTIHRFTFDCGGVAVPWVEAVAAAEPHRDGMWVQDGRLYVRMPPAWSMAPDDPCGRAPDLGDRWRFSRLSRFCADRLANMPPAVVELPPGFAPIFELDAIFVPAPVPQAALGPPNPSVGSWKDSEVVPPEKRPDISPKAAAPREPPPRAKAQAETAERPAPQVKSAEPTNTRTAAVVPKIINQKPASDSSDGRPAGAAGGEKADGPPRVFAEPRVNADKTVVTGSTSKLEPSGGQSGSSANPLNTSQLSVATISIGFVLFVLTAGLAVLFARRREHAELAAVTSRDIASVALDSKSRRGALTVATLRGDRGTGSPPSRRAPSSGRQDLALVDGGRIPQTREEALEVLGMGVAADAGQAAIKKIVDGLRLSWHPDFAVDEADRDARELRLKQINAAWQILAGDRS